jgi:hypothetical protein
MKSLGLIFRDKRPPCEEDDFLISMEILMQVYKMKVLTDDNTGKQVPLQK